jgi:hypothetical protein
VIREISLVSPEEASLWGRVVLDHSEHFIDRGHFDTLGASAYLDDPGEHPAIAKKHNPVLISAFAGLYEAISATLGGILNSEIQFHPNGAVPGFHVFTSKTGDAEGDPHIDQPYQRLLWPEPFHSPFSFTMALTLPEEAGLNYWIDGKLHYQPYKAGCLYLHSGLFPHQIAKPVAPTDEAPRITLQGHGARLGFSGVTVIYF